MSYQDINRYGGTWNAYYEVKGARVGFQPYDTVDKVRRSVVARSLGRRGIKNACECQKEGAHSKCTCLLYLGLGMCICVHVGRCEATCRLLALFSSTKFTQYIEQVIIYFDLRIFLEATCMNLIYWLIIQSCLSYSAWMSTVCSRHSANRASNKKPLHEALFMGCPCYTGTSRGWCFSLFLS